MLDQVLCILLMVSQGERVPIAVLQQFVLGYVPVALAFFSHFREAALFLWREMLFEVVREKFVISLQSMLSIDRCLEY